MIFVPLALLLASANEAWKQHLNKSVGPTIEEKKDKEAKGKITMKQLELYEKGGRFSTGTKFNALEHGVSKAPIPVIDFWSKVLNAAAKHNVSAGSMVGICQDLVNEYANASVGSKQDLARVYAGPTYDTLVDQACEVLSGGGCYEEYGVTFDGTLSFSEAEAVIL
eukprot:13857715-Ditylum_brightwellii.AAC.2